jgi:predicted nucleotidyltransferase
MRPQALEQLKTALRPAFERQGVRLAYLFGSQATGQTHAESDTDVAVLLPDTLTPMRQHEIRMDLIGAMMDSCESDAVDIAVLNETDPVFRREVTAAGILLFGPPDEASRFVREVQNEFLATAAERKLQGVALRRRIAERVAQRQAAVSP